MIFPVFIKNKEPEYIKAKQFPLESMRQDLDFIDFRINELELVSCCTSDMSEINELQKERNILSKYLSFKRLEECEDDLYMLKIQQAVREIC
jgi:hypothetical protein